MNDKEYYVVSSSLFLIVAVAHLMRAVYGLEASVAGVSIPIWFSWAAAVIVGYLAVRGFSTVCWKGLKSGKPRKK